MRHYAIKCVSRGEQVLAQKILNKKGIKWGDGLNERIMVKENGLYLIVRGKRITFLHLDQFDDRDRDNLEPVEFNRFIHKVRHKL